MRRRIVGLACVLAVGSTLVGTSPVQAMASQRCVLESATDQLDEGVTDRGLLPHAGDPDLDVVLIPIDFADARASRTAAETLDLLGPDAEAYYSESSYGRFTLSVTGAPSTYRMPKSSSAYGLNDGITYEEVRNIVGDALTLADPDVDFSTFDAFSIAFPPGAAYAGGNAIIHPSGYGWTHDSVEVRFGMLLSDDPSHRWRALVHELGHVLGMPDLYDLGPPISNPGSYLEWRQRFAGAWDPMSRSAIANELFTWHKWKLGWLTDDEIACVGQGTSTVTLTPNGTAGGVKAAVIPVSATKAFVAEVRTALGRDVNICEEGLLVYSVDTSIAPPQSQGPIRVQAAGSDTSTSERAACGDLYNAPFALGAGETASFEDTTAGVAFQIDAVTDGAYTITATYSGSYAPPRLTGDSDRTVSLVLKKHLVAKGLASASLSACLPAAVNIEKYKQGAWVAVAEAAVDQVTGAYKRKLADKKGLYRATVAEGSASDSDGDYTCAAATSSEARHKH